jgi:hypothetical protein
MEPQAEEVVPILLFHTGVNRNLKINKPESFIKSHVTPRVMYPIPN